MVTGMPAAIMGLPFGKAIVGVRPPLLTGVAVGPKPGSAVSASCVSPLMTPELPSPGKVTRFGPMSVTVAVLALAPFCKVLTRRGPVEELDRMLSVRVVEAVGGLPEPMVEPAARL